MATILRQKVGRIVFNRGGNCQLMRHAHGFGYRFNEDKPVIAISIDIFVKSFVWSTDDLTSCAICIYILFLLISIYDHCFWFRFHLLVEFVAKSFRPFFFTNQITPGPIIERSFTPKNLQYTI